MVHVPTPDELAETLVAMLVGAAGGSAAKWRKAIGPVERLMPVHMHVRCNWQVSPKGSAADLETIEKAVEIVRAVHPYVTE